MNRKNRKNKNSSTNIRPKLKPIKEVFPDPLKLFDVQEILKTEIKENDVKIYNVGQGNGVIVKSKNLNKNININWIIDFGGMGSQILENGADVDKNYSSNLVSDAVNNFCPTELNEKNYGVIMISHPDLDHYNIIPDILTKCKNKQKIENDIRNFLYWIFPMSYSEKDIKQKNFFSKYMTYYMLQFYLPQRRIIFNQEDLISQNIENSFYFINYGSWGNSKLHKNSNSLIIRLRSYHNNNKVLILGDADDYTLEEIEDFPKNLLDKNHAGKIKTVLASHHGSETYGSNNIINEITLEDNADIIFSAGQSNHKHPRCISINIASEILKENIKSHEILCYNKSSKKEIKISIGKKVFSTGQLSRSQYSYDR